jgi:hypothetical protein
VRKLGRYSLRVLELLIGGSDIKGTPKGGGSAHLTPLRFLDAGTSHVIRIVPSTSYASATSTSLFRLCTLKRAVKPSEPLLMFGPHASDVELFLSFSGFMG